MPYAHPDALVETDWLADHLDAPDVRVVDATFVLPGGAEAAKRMYDEEHIPGAVFFDVSTIADTSSPYDNTLPPAEVFSARVRKLGLGDGNRIVVYDANGGNSAAARVWWMFRLFGHRDIAVLNGGLPKWKAEGRPVTDEVPVLSERHFTARKDTFLERDRDGVLKAVGNGSAQIVDARAGERFRGDVAEPRPGLRAGHIPGSKNVPSSQLYDADTKVLKSADDLRALFEGAGVDLSKPVITSCGSGVTACALAFALYQIGHTDVAVYDGSWAEWGSNEDLPIETGA